MEKHVNDGKPIAFAFYKDGKLIGYRQDTVGSIGEHPKIYHYSKDQIETVLKNINYNVTHKEGIGKALMKITGDPNAQLVADGEEKVHNMLQDKRAFEVRVVEAPEYEKEFDVASASYKINYFGGYPTEQVAIWIQSPEDHNVLETHFFSMDGQINLQ